MSKVKKDTAIILKRIDYGEADRIITLFTREHGKIALIAKGVRKITSRRRGHIEPLSKVSASFVVKDYGGLGYLSEVESLGQYVHPRHALHDVGHMAHVCELVDRLLPDAEPNEYVFRLLQRALEVLSTEYEEEKKKDVLRLFGISLLQALGFWDEEHYAKNIAHRPIDAVLDWQYAYIETITERELKSIRLVGMDRVPR